MDIFKGLFRNFFRSNQPGRNYEDKTPYKIQVMRKALTGMNVECAGGVYRLLVPKVLEAVAVFTSHGNSGSSAPWEIDFVKRLCNWDIISPLTFKAYAELKNNKH